MYIDFENIRDLLLVFDIFYPMKDIVDIFGLFPGISYNGVWRIYD